MQVLLGVSIDSPLHKTISWILFRHIYFLLQLLLLRCCFVFFFFQLRALHEVIKSTKLQLDEIRELQEQFGKGNRPSLVVDVSQLRCTKPCVALVLDQEQFTFPCSRCESTEPIHRFAFPCGRCHRPSSH